MWFWGPDNRAVPPVSPGDDSDAEEQRYCEGRMAKRDKWRPAVSKRRRGRNRELTDVSLDRADMLPLDVMLAVIAGYFRAGNYDKAARLAAKTAPYCHPKVAHVHSTGGNRGAKLNVEAKLSLELLSDDQQIALRAVLQAGKRQ
jgi:hypothetical protein